MKKENSISSKMVAAAGEYVAAYMEQHLDKQFCYHDYQHTLCVVNAVVIICHGMNVSKKDTMLLMVAAWFHDTGYTKQQVGHEGVSASIAEAFLQQKNINQAEIELVKKYILSTKYPQQPSGLSEQIICDADMFHLSSGNLPVLSEKLRQEWKESKKQTYSDKEWYELNLQFLSEHYYHTSWSRQKLQIGIEKNIALYKGKITDAEKTVTSQGAPYKKEKKKKDKANPGRGVETLFRTASGNHMRLSAMADNKAHILLSINSVIISVILAVLAKNLHTHTHLIIPTALLLLTCLSSLVFAVLTTKPKLSNGVFTTEQINNREVNLLFFGNFYKMQLEAYEWGIKEIMNNKEHLYGSMTKDIYFQGKVLAVKYKYLNVGYKFFMYGVIASVVAFLISFIA